MLTAVRSPSDCRFRRAVPDPSGNSTACGLIERLAADGDCRVGDDTCAACCRAERPTEGRPNEVVASMVHAIWSDKLQTTTSAREFVCVSENLTWIEQFLRVDRPGLRVVSAPGIRRVSLVDYIRRMFHPRRTSRIGLVGWNNLKGLGHQNRDLARWLPVERWLVPASAAVEEGKTPVAQGTTRIDHLPNTNQSRHAVRRWLEGVDVVLFVETPLIDGLTARARAQGMRVVCVPNWEWLHPGLEWLHDVDAMLCPTIHTRQVLDEWRQRYGFEWDVHYCPWPIDVEAFPFRLRTTCRRFVSVIGTDQRHPRRLDGTPTDTRRKGLEVLLAAARQLPHIPFLVWSQTDDLPPLPANVELRMSSANNAELYQDGDVCVQLSRWEGLGLPLLECQAAGMPLITIDAPPMNEHNPLAVVRVAESEVLELWPGRFIAAPIMRVEDVVAVLAAWFGRDIQRASQAGREFVERDHSWSNLRSVMLDMIAPTPVA